MRVYICVCATPAAARRLYLSPCNSYYLSCTLAARADLFIGRAQVLIPHSGRRRRCVSSQAKPFVCLAPSARAPSD